jgi:hypothetical protein
VQYARLHREKDAEGISNSTTTTSAGGNERHRISIRLEAEEPRQRNLTSCNPARRNATIRRVTGLTLDHPVVDSEGPEEDALAGGLMRISLDWWAVLAAAVAVVLIKTGLVAGIPW